MHMRARFENVARWFGATMAAVVTSLALVLMRVNPAAAGMIFLVLVVWSATQAGLRLSLYIAVLSALCFDYFFLPPYHTLVLAGGQEWVAMFSFLSCSLVAGRVAERARRQAQQAEQRREDVERLYTLSQEMMLHDDAASLLRDLPSLVAHTFALEHVILYVRDSDEFHSSRADIHEDVRASLRDLAAAKDSAFSLLGGYDGKALMLGLRPVGSLAWRPARLSREVATAVSAQVAIALTRSVAIEAFTRIQASREGERLRAALIDSLTHELRTPLTSIRAAATTLMQGEGLDDASRLDLAAIVEEEATRLDALIGDAVEMAEIDAHVVHVRAVSQHTRTLLEHAVEQSHSALARHQVVIAVEEPDNPAQFDPHLLGRVFRHLLENAARYSAPGSLIVLRSGRAAERLQFAVEDNGPGIDAVDLPLIFEKFYRGKNGASRGRGTGMGLAIARSILLAHGGSIAVTSTAGQGTIFNFWVPLVEKESPSER